ncbi:hypothetical protein BGZ54_000119 [Gamsiella multidivaricata]|nr:hypothetical protein BGZ54_000119 [Gamsiella multidivaricata]
MLITNRLPNFLVQVAATFNVPMPEHLPSLGLTGDANLDDLLNLEESATPRKRDRGERIVWTPEEDEYLRTAVQLYGDKTEKWAKIAACVPGRTNKNCRKRWFHSLDPKLKKGPWTEEEDHLLKTGVQMFKGQWSKIAERIPGRTDDQCAKRWREGLDPLIDRAAWTPEDDLLLLQRFEEFGSQWQKIALAFPGRPGLHCRNRWRKLQRSLNHMKRTSKRRSQGSGSDHAAIMSETRRLEALLDSHNDDMDMDMLNFNSAEDVLLLQDAYLDDDFALEHGIMLEEDGSITIAKDTKAEAEQNESEDDKPYGCAVLDCSFVSSSPSLLFYHFKASHAGVTVEKPFRCTMPGCETRKRYKNINGLQYHVTHAKNSPGHSTHGHSPSVEDGADPSRAARAGSQTIPVIHGSHDTPRTRTSSPRNDLRITMSGATFDPSKITLSNAPTPAEIQLQLHQSRQDLSQPPSAPHLSHSAFNIPHNVSSLEGSVVSSRASSGASSPQIQRTVFHCPELGCSQSYHQIHELNIHMTNSHIRHSMSVGGSDTMYGPDTAIVSRDNHRAEFDIDMTDLTSGAASPMDSSLLLLEEPLLRNQLDAGNRMSLDLGPLPGTPLDSNTCGSSNVNASDGLNEFEALSGKDCFFATPVANSLQSPIPFTSHINVSTHEPLSIQTTSASAPVPTPALAAAIVITTTASGSANPIASFTVANLVPTALPTVQSQKSSRGQTSRSGVAKRFACSAANCNKSYAGATTLNNHIRNDHPELYASTSGTGSTASGQRTMVSMDIPNSPEPSKDDGSDVADDMPYKCLVPGCGKGYKNINGLKNHLLQTHGSTPKTSTAA